MEANDDNDLLAAQGEQHVVHSVGEPPAKSKDGNGHEISVCPRIRNPMGADMGLSLYSRARAQA
jgi:hypothetical protein